MQELFSSLMESSGLPFITAFVLGLMTAISPCPLATNITAIGFISKDISEKKRVFLNGVVYTLGRAFTYTAIALIIYLGMDQFKISGFFQRYGEKFIGPLLVLIGLFMLGILKINFPGTFRLTRRFEEKGIEGYWGAFMMGVLFALAFCPYSGVLYFGMLIPMTVSAASGLYLPVVFALATGIPVIIIAWLIAYALSEVSKFYQKLKNIELWFRRFVAVLFMGVGVYYIIIIYLIR